MNKYIPICHTLASAFFAAAWTLAGLGCSQSQASMEEPAIVDKFVYHGAGNPYLPMWEHLPDGEPRVFEDPDNPGKYRAYIIGSHDVRFDSYCAADIRMWSAPVEDLSSWRDEGPIFRYFIDGQWDVMYAPDLVEVNRKDGTREYYLYPHSRGYRREAMVCKGSRPDGPFTPINLTEDGKAAVPGSILGFDPSVFIEPVTDPKDPDFNIGFRAYGYWGFQHSMACQLDQNTMYSVRPGTDVIPYHMPAGKQYGELREPNVDYPCIAKGENLGQFNFFEASSIRQIGNKYVAIYSGYSGPDYGIASSNSTLRYAYADNPLGPWKIGGVLVDSRAPMVNFDGSAIEPTNAGHNTHGSMEQINGQWYVFYHRPPRGFGFARQPMVAPVLVQADEAKVADGGKVVIRAYDPYTSDHKLTVRDSQGHEYLGAEVTSEGFHIFGLNPYQYYNAGICCYLNYNCSQDDSWDIWDNAAPIVKIRNGAIMGYKYFGFGGLDKDQLGIKAFEGTKPGNNTQFNVFIKPTTKQPFKIEVWMDAPWNNAVWQGKKLGTIDVNDAEIGESMHLTLDVNDVVDVLDKKHAIYLVVSSASSADLFELLGLGFSKNGQEMERPVPPTVQITVNGRAVDIPATPVRSNNQNGIVGYDLYDVNVTLSASSSEAPKVTAESSSKDVFINVQQAATIADSAVVKCNYQGVVKTYRVAFRK